MKELFNEYVKSIDTYIMFRIKQKAAQLKPELEAKDRVPIALAMGAPVAPPPEFVYKKLVEALKIPQIHILLGGVIKKLCCDSHRGTTPI